MFLYSGVVCSLNLYFNEWITLCNEIYFCPYAGVVCKSDEGVDSELSDDSIDWKSMYLRAYMIEHHWRNGEVKPTKVSFQFNHKCNHRDPFLF